MPYLKKPQLNTEQDLDHYLDDFIGCDNTVPQVNLIIQEPIMVCGLLNVPIAWDKTVWGTVFFRFLGLDVDTVNQLVHIPPHKVLSLDRKLHHVLKSKTVQVKTLQSLAGTINFYAKAKPGGRTFIRRIYDGEQGLTKHFHINVTSELKKDLRVWQELLSRRELATLFCDVLKTRADDIQFLTDASGNERKGWGVYLVGKWSQGVWPQEFLQQCNPSIAWLELYPIVLAVKAWGHKFTGKCILVHCDNKATVAMINEQTSPSRSCMDLLRILVFCQI